ncbi:hypothetical protein AB0M43_33615 [Longispora sp. NPDC051575]|uniref:VG15 protein n=1 Tax=Longispora sp. NPDC051575 TaxID=3154943 RepID=UPI0034377CC6
MAATLADRAALTERHRLAQLGVRARFTSAFLDTWPVLDARQVAATAPRWLRLTVPLVAEHRHQSATVAADYYHRLRAASLPTGAAPGPVAQPVDPDLDAVRTSLLVTGPATIRRLSRDGRPVDEAARIASVRATGAASRHVLDGGRDLIHTAVAADPVALAWARVSDGSPCAFCAMLLSRGPVYKTKRAATLAVEGDREGKEYHDGCACQPVPIYSLDEPWPGNGRQFEQLWKDVAAGSSDPLNAFRQAIKEQRAAAPADPVAQPAPAEPNLAADAPQPDRAPDDLFDEPAAPAPMSDEQLAHLDDEQLAEEFSRATNTATPDEAYLEQILSEMDRREGIGDQAVEQLDPLDGVALDELLDGELFDLYDEHAGNLDVVGRIGDELARRDADAQAADPWLDYDHHDPEQHLDALLARGWDYREAYAEAYNLDPAELDRQERAAAVDAQRITGETREQTVRRLYDEWLGVQYLAAEDFARGHLLSKEGPAAAVDPLSLFSGTSARARKYASEDLKRFWDEQSPRQTFTEFKAALLNRDADVAAAAKTRAQGNGRDFGL